ncbi:uncharacterized protein [Euphorbia lathyris]|uniref:uncharacterized protein n=2 Tax=Euphorbia lathyris TaxID=212925 RepID=UPI003313628B
MHNIWICLIFFLVHHGQSRLFRLPHLPLLEVPLLVLIEHVDTWVHEGMQHPVLLEMLITNSLWIIDNHIASLITSIVQQYPQAVAWQYKMIPDAILQKYWEEFKKDCVWDSSMYSDDIIKKAFIAKLKERYAGIMNGVRKMDIMPPWCPRDVWDAWWRVWDSAAFKRISEQAKKTRLGKDGVAKGTHTAGSVSHAKTAQQLEKEIGKPLNPDQFFLWAHTKDHDGVTFVNDRCRKTQEAYENLTQVEVEQTTKQLVGSIDELRAFYQAAGGVNKDGEIFGLGSAASQYYHDRRPRNSRASSSSSSVGASNLGDSTELHEIRATLETVQERLNGFNDERSGFITHLEQVNERQDRLVEGIHLLANASDMRHLQERMTNIETQMGPAISQIQIAITGLQASVRRLECSPNLG